MVCVSRMCPNWRCELCAQSCILKAGARSSPLASWLWTPQGVMALSSSLVLSMAETCTGISARPQEHRIDTPNPPYTPRARNLSTPEADEPVSATRANPRFYLVIEQVCDAKKKKESWDDIILDLGCDVKRQRNIQGIRWCEEEEQKLELCGHKTKAASNTRSWGKRLGFSCRTSKRNQPSDTRISESGLQNRERINSVALSHPVCATLVTWTQEHSHLFLLL